MWNSKSDIALSNEARLSERSWTSGREPINNTKVTKFPAICNRQNEHDAAHLPTQSVDDHTFLVYRMGARFLKASLASGRVEPRFPKLFGEINNQERQLTRIVRTALAFLFLLSAQTLVAQSRVRYNDQKLIPSGANLA